ncbi:hypothetical protein K502DRAFT_353840 [Neoconidiobolus thromboides FSU 785]|nr:hypothetical protein K502DRAFT_353840 [Neoconidiobolus thromboides FSU 785]
MRSILLYSAFSITVLNAISITPIRAILGDEDAILKLCVGNLAAAKIPGSHEIADLKVDLKEDKKLHCGPNNTPASKSLLDLLLLGKDPCSHFKVLSAKSSKYGKGINAIDIVLNTIQPHCKDQVPKPNSVPKVNSPPGVVTPKPADTKPAHPKPHKGGDKNYHNNNGDNYDSDGDYYDNGDYDDDYDNGYHNHHQYY